MQLGMSPKYGARACLGAAAGIVCLVGLACLFAAKVNREILACSSDNTLPRDPDRIVTRDDAPPPSATGETTMREACATPAGNLESAESPSTRFGGITNLNTDGDAEERAGNEESTSEAIAELKEKFMRDTFGVIRRKETWIPTSGDGSNRVYITTGSLPAGRLGEFYDLTFLATSGSTPYRWSIVESELPAAFALDPVSGRLSGTPGEPTTSTFFLEVTDSQGTKDRAAYILTLRPENGLGIATTKLPAAHPGSDYAVQLQATGGIPPYVWNVTGNPEPIGSLVLDPQSGALYGNIATSAPQSDIPLLIGASDAQQIVSTQLMLHVRNALSILTAPTSTVVRVAEPVHVAFEATGGTEPYVWGLDTPLPPGIEFTAEGLCSGQPSEPGCYRIDVWVRDTAGQVDTAQVTLEVLPQLADSISKFEALLSRNRVALSWVLTTTNENLLVRIVRSATGIPLMPSDGTTIYCGPGASCLDDDVDEGDYNYTAFLEYNGTMVTAAASPGIFAKLPPETDPFADNVVSINPLHPNPFRSTELPQIVLGAPHGTGLAWGSTDIVSLGAATRDDGGGAPYGGAITLEFADNEVWDGPGSDFTIFENVFYICNEAGIPDPETRFMEPAVVAVSQDGVNWRQFPTDFSPRYDPHTGVLNLRHPYCYNSGFAGVNPVMSDGLNPDPTDTALSGGDSFDLSVVGLAWIRYVRIQSTGSRWLIDNDGDLVYHDEETGAATRSNNKSGFDLDAMTAIWMKKVESH